MPKKIFLFLTVLCIGLYSCSDDKNEIFDPAKDLVEIDYVADLGYFKDLTVNKDGTIYSIAYDHLPAATPMSLKKVSSDGTVTILTDLGIDYFGNTMRLASSEDGKPYWTTDTPSHSNEIFSFSDDFTKIESFEMRRADGPFAITPGLTSIIAYENNSFVVFDVANKQLKRYYPDLGVDILMAGSEKNEIKDGVGLDASFMFVNRIVDHGGTLYVIDNLKNIRKVEKQESLPKVTTILADYPETINDIAIDGDANIYVATNNGLFILKKGAKDLELISNKNNINVKTKDKTVTSLHLERVINLYIDKNDLYLVNSYGSLTKISGFKTKLKELKDKGML